MRRLATCLAACLSGCVQAPESYRIPPQHEPFGLSASATFTEFVRSGEMGADAYFVKDIQGLEGKSQRWAHAEPEFRFFVKTTANRRFRLDFSIFEQTFRETGPVTIVYVVNGHELDRVRYNTPGRKTFEKPVAAEWLKTGVENRVVVQVLNPWQSPEDGVRLGFLLHGAGFVSE